MMTSVARFSAVAILIFSAGHGTLATALADCPDCPGIPIHMPVTKAYRILPGFCPEQLVWLVRQCVSTDGSCPGCGPFGIPPIYSAGNFVAVRQTPEVHAR